MKSEATPPRAQAPVPPAEVQYEVADQVDDCIPDGLRERDGSARHGRRQCQVLMDALADHLRDVHDRVFDIVEQKVQRRVPGICGGLSI